MTTVAIYVVGSMVLIGLGLIESQLRHIVEELRRKR